jgi:tetratricopeptide (TPR) repeat protein
MFASNSWLDIHSLKAEVLFKLEKYEEAVASVSKGAFSDFEKNNFIGQCYFELGNLEEAIKYAKFALDLDSTDQSALSNLAWYFYTKGNSKVAYKYIKKAVAGNSLTATSLHTLALIEYSLGKIKDANSHFEEALEGDPLMVEALFEYGKILVKQKRISSGLKLLHRASILGYEKADEFLEDYFMKRIQAG